MAWLLSRRVEEDIPEGLFILIILFEEKASWVKTIKIWDFILHESVKKQWLLEEGTFVFFKWPVFRTQIENGASFNRSRVWRKMKEGLNLTAKDFAGKSQLEEEGRKLCFTCYTLSMGVACSYSSAPGFTHCLVNIPSFVLHSHVKLSVLGNIGQQMFHQRIKVLFIAREILELKYRNLMKTPFYGKVVSPNWCWGFYICATPHCNYARAQCKLFQFEASHRGLVLKEVER